MSLQKKCLAVLLVLSASVCLADNVSVVYGEPTRHDPIESTVQCVRSIGYLDLSVNGEKI